MQRALVLGLGISGIDTARFLADRGWRVTVYDDNAAKLAAADDRYEKSTGDLPPDGVDLLVLSPGVPPTHPLVVAAKRAGVEVAGEMELAARYIDGETVIAVTGTNGKSTTVTLIHEMLLRDGRRSALTGNIGESLISFVGKGYEFLVIEVSSFQLETLRSLHPAVALILNVSPDHLDRYANYGEYLAVKASLGELVAENGTLIVNGGDGPLCAAVAGIPRRTLFFSAVGKSDAAWDGGAVSYDGVTVDMARTALRGTHNVENVMAALMAVRPFLRDTALMAEAVYAFTPLPHRMAFVASVGGVDFIDDSKGTNVGAVEKSLAGFPDRSVVLILGGVDKGGGYRTLLPLLDRAAKGVVVMGEATPRIRADLADFTPLVPVADMAEAVEKGYELAAGSGTVLLSPACSSFDRYENYKERGRDFVAKATALKRRIEG